MILLFWTSLAIVLYAYAGYPLVLAITARLRKRRGPDQVPETSKYVPDMPSLSVIIPAFNEQDHLHEKLVNTFDQEYPSHLQVILVSDGSTDGTVDIAREFESSHGLIMVALGSRNGKALALNAGLQVAAGDIVVFTDASIKLGQDALKCLAEPFRDPEVGCVSGEDFIEGHAGEGLYGRYELMLRRLESQVYSIVGASGSIYAQRRELVGDFPQELAPDFHSVMNTVRQGKLARSTPYAVGMMRAQRGSQGEFERKVRTVVRGMTALFCNKDLLNPVRYPIFAFELLSHKLLRWLVPFFLITLLLSNMFMLDSTFYRLAFVAQVVFYLLALVGLLFPGLLRAGVLIRVAAFFCLSNAAILVAWIKYLGGYRQEIWQPTRRDQ